MSSAPDATPAPTPPFDPAVRKKVLRMIPYGMYVITSKHGDHVAAATIDWVTQSSFEPPMVVCCLRADSQIYELISQSRIYALHPLGEGQKPFAQHFFKNRSADATHINGQSYKLDTHGVPILDDAPAHLTLKVKNELKDGDHVVVLGQVIDVALVRETPPLLLRDTGWHYGG